MVADRDELIPHGVGLVLLASGREVVVGERLASDRLGVFTIGLLAPTATSTFSGAVRLDLADVEPDAGQEQRELTTEAVGTLDTDPADLQAELVEPHKDLSEAVLGHVERGQVAASAAAVDYADGEVVLVRVDAGNAPCLIHDDPPSLGLRW